MRDFFLGTNQACRFQFCPGRVGVVLGPSLAISQNTALFSLIGTTFGGNGVQTFNLPDLRGCVAVGQGQGPGLSNYDQGQTGGSETVVVHSSEIIAVR